MRSAVGILLTAALWTCPLRGDWRATARVGGAISAVAARDALVLVGVGPRVHVFDITDPASPREVGSTPSFADDVLDICIVASRAYVAAGTDGVQIVDVSDPTALRVIGKWDSAGSAEGVTAEGELLYVADGPSGLAIVDVANPAAPTLLVANMQIVATWIAAPANQIAQVAYRDGSVYATAGPLLLVLDVRNPRQPVQIAFENLSDVFTGDVLLEGPYAYVANGSAGVAVIDIRNPLQPAIVAQIPVAGFATELAGQGGDLLVASSTGGLVVVRQVQSGLVLPPGEGAPELVEEPPVSLTPASAIPGVAPTACVANAQRSVLVSSSADSGPGTLREALAHLAPAM